MDVKQPADAWGTIEWAVGALWVVTLAGAAALWRVAYHVGLVDTEVSESKKAREKIYKELADLREETHSDLRKVVHDLRQELQLAAKVNDIHRLDQHLERQDKRLEERLNWLTEVIVTGRKEK
jgi:flagellar motility protein MotE (MotC chaperone)